LDSELLRWLMQVAPVALRVGGALTFGPFLGDGGIPNRIKVGLLIVLTALLFPVVPLHSATLAPVNWMQMVLGELAVGLSIGLSLQVVFEAMQFAGNIAGIQLGLSLASLFDPQSNAESTALPVFFNLITIVLFLQLNVHHWVLRGLARSFEYLPVGSAVLTQLMTRDLVRIVGALFILGIQIAAPILIATLMIDITISFVSRASPQLPAMLLGIPVKSLTGFALLTGAAALWPGILERQFGIAIGAAERLLHLAR
jgi:flagellar biosynthetic protein FliR